MKLQIFLIGLVFFLSIAGLGCLIASQTENPAIDHPEVLNKFYGPVPQGYNQTHYWQTGEMILENNGNN